MVDCLSWRWGAVLGAGGVHAHGAGADMDRGLEGGGPFTEEIMRRRC